MLQLLFKSPIPSPLNLYIDYDSATVIYSGFEKNHTDEFISVRLCGKLQCFSRQSFLNGPFRTGLITAASSLSFNQRIANLYLKLISGASSIDRQLFFDKCRSLSLRASPSASVQSAVADLISHSARAPPLFAIPWF